MAETASCGMLLQMQPFSVNDGQGIRTLIFLPGCNLRCQWCSNPETWTPEPKLAFYGNKCLGCGHCRSVCPKGIFPAERQAAAQGCDACGLCAAECPGKALAVLCRSATADEIVKRALRDEIFYRHSGGGVTFSGGEPLYQEAFLRELSLRFERLGIDMWIETCGVYQWDRVSDIFARLSHVFFDLKCMDSGLHRKLTGAPNDVILENAVHVHDLGLPMTVRIPCVKGVNFTTENIGATAKFMSMRLPKAEVELLPYHNFGSDKYRALGMEDRLHEEFQKPEKEDLEAAKQVFRGYGVKVTEYR